MATITYTLSSKIDKRTGKQEILVRLFHGRFNQRGKTNLYGYSKHWDERAQRFSIPKVRSMTIEKREEIQELQKLNTELDHIAKYLIEAFITAGSNKVELPEKWVADTLLLRTRERIEEEAPEMPAVEESEEDTENISENRQEEFFKTFEHFVSIQKISEIRKRHYNVIIRALKRFALYNVQEVSFATLSSDMLREFAAFLETEHEFVGVDDKGKPCIKDPLYLEAYTAVPECRLPKQRGENTIIGTMSRFHTFIRWARKNKYISEDPYDDYVIGTAIYGTPFYLTKEERNQLYAAKFPDNPGLDVQRDIFVFQCFIGCRVGDLMKMTRDNIINGAIEYVPRKTKEGRPWTVRVPITPTAQEILDRYADLPDKRLLPFICEQDYNRAIKKMIKLAGINRMVTTLNTVTREEEKHPIWEVASSHMARRVLVGNLYKEVKDPNLIAKISGHVENSRAFSRYRDIDEEMAKETIMKLE